MRISEAKIESDFGEFEESDKILVECLGLADKKVYEDEEVGNKLKAQVLQEIGKNSMLHSSYNEREKD